MIKLFAAFVLTMGVAVQSLAKDGPFPIYNAVGTWQAIGQTFQLKIEVLKPGKEKALVKVLAKNSRSLTAAGVTLFDLKNEQFDITLIYPDGKHLAIKLKADYKVVAGSNKRVLQLAMEMIELDSPTHSIVPSSLVKIGD